MDTLKIAKASIVGLSPGAIVATDFALEYPDYVHKLVLVTPGIHGWEKNVPEDSLVRKNQELMRQALVELKDTVLAAELFIRSWFDGPQRKPFEVDSSERGRHLKWQLHRQGIINLNTGPALPLYQQQSDYRRFGFLY